MSGTSTKLDLSCTPPTPAHTRFLALFSKQFLWDVVLLVMVRKCYFCSCKGKARSSRGANSDSWWLHGEPIFFRHVTSGGCPLSSEWPHTRSYTGRGNWTQWLKETREHELRRDTLETYLHRRVQSLIGLHSDLQAMCFVCHCPIWLQSQQLSSLKSIWDRGWQGRMTGCTPAKSASTKALL